MLQKLDVKKVTRYKYYMLQLLHVTGGHRCKVQENLLL